MVKGSGNRFGGRALLWTSLMAVAPFAAAADEWELGNISITATREERQTEEVPQAIAVVGKQQLEDKKMFNVKEALQGIPGVMIDSENGGNDARLIIRGAGLKAPYGIREIMVLRDGVPLTDPDSFTKLDFIDTQDIERIEVAKGPGNLFATGSVGGAIQIISRSVFDKSANNVKLGIGDYNARNAHFRYGGNISEDQALALTTSYRATDNDWRRWNKFDSNQTSLKHGLMLGNGDTLESEISYSESNTQLPGTMDDAMFDEFKRTGKQEQSAGVFQNSGRYSKTWFLNSRYEMTRGDITFKPRIYANTWYHYHPVTGFINEEANWVTNIGTDLEATKKHEQGSLVGGVTFRQEETPDARKYLYRDALYGTYSHGTCGGADPGEGSPSRCILTTYSDAKGALASKSESKNVLSGVYFQESWRPDDKWIIDAGMRYDRVDMKDTTTDYFTFTYGTNVYAPVASPTPEVTKKSFYLPAPKVAVSYKVNEAIHVYGVVAQAGQIPSSSEITSNPDLEAPIARNYEVGLKGRSAVWQFDAALYLNPVEKEIVQVSTGRYTWEYQNAGSTDKKGLELSGAWNLNGNWQIGGYYNYSDFVFKDFTERVSGTNVDRSGNHLPFIPLEQYGLVLNWKSGDGWRAQLASNTWGSYWMDNANTEKYKGWEWVTNAMVGYEKKPHAVVLNVDNLMDQRYAYEVKKDLYNNRSYVAGAPRTTNLTYTYRF